MAENTEKLFDMFPPISTEEWKAKIITDLKGADFDKKLVWRTNEGFNVQPFYRAEDIEGLYTLGSMPGQFPYVRGTRDKNTWLIRQQIQGETAEEMNRNAVHVLDRGVDSLGFKLDKDFNTADFATLFRDIDLKKVEINIDACPLCIEKIAAGLVEYINANGLADDFRGSVDFNPYKRLIKHGLPFPEDICKVAMRVYEIVKPVKGLRCFAVDSYIFCNAGAYITEELAYALSWGAQWMTMMTEAGLKPCEVADRIKFNMGISPNYFMELAKFRAGRLLWAETVKAYNPCNDDCCKMKVHATTSQFNQTIFDAHVNLLRSMTETMSAALAGVDSIETLPFDLQYQQPDEFSERIARNQQLLLREESHLDKVADPAGGSYYVEVLTASIAQQAWKIFNEIDDLGGFDAAMTSGELQKRVNASNVKRHTDVARRKEILLGTNQYPNFNEKALDKIVKESCGKCCGEKCEGNAVEAIKFDRAASEFEALRLATERSSKRPKVFMLTIGNLAMRLARAQFSSNFFGCAGYEIIDNIGFDTVKAGVDAAVEKGADIVVLCSSDDEYAQFAPEAYKELNGRALFVVAGAPACMDDLKAQGIEDFIHVRVNVLETLKGFNAKLLK